jgi:hypothetical protein
LWLGAFVVWASIPASLVLLVSLVTVNCHTDSSVKLLSVSAWRAVRSCGYQLDLLYLAPLLVITLQGPVSPSIDHMLRPNVHMVKEDACSHSITASRPE